MFGISFMRLTVVCTWLCVGLAIGVAADLVEDLAFEVQDVSSVEGVPVAGEGDDVPIRATRLADVSSQDYQAPHLLPHAPVFVEPTTDPRGLGGSLTGHGPPGLDLRFPSCFVLPLRI